MGLREQSAQLLTEQLYGEHELLNYKPGPLHRLSLYNDVFDLR